MDFLNRKGGIRSAFHTWWLQETTNHTQMCSQSVKTLLGQYNRAFQPEKGSDIMFNDIDVPNLLKWIFYQTYASSIYRRISKLSSIPLPWLCFSLWIVQSLFGSPWYVRKIWWLHLRQVSIEVCSMWLFQSSAQPKIWQFDMTTSIKQEVIWFDVPKIRNVQIYLNTKRAWVFKIENTL